VKYQDLASICQVLVDNHSDISVYILIHHHSLVFLKKNELDVSPLNITFHLQQSLYLIKYIRIM